MKAPPEDPLATPSGRPPSQPLSKTPSRIFFRRPLRSVPRVPKLFRSHPEALPSAPSKLRRNLLRKPSEYDTCPEDQPGSHPSKPLSESPSEHDTCPRVPEPQDSRKPPRRNPPGSSRVHREAQRVILPGSLRMRHVSPEDSECAASDTSPGRLRVRRNHPGSPRVRRESSE